MTEPTSPGADEQDIGDLDNETIFTPGDIAPAGVGHDAGDSGRDPYFVTPAGKAWLDQGASG